MRKTPNLPRSPVGACAQMSSAIARVRRVSAGSITPSSHRRAVEYQQVDFSSNISRMGFRSPLVPAQTMFHPGVRSERAGRWIGSLRPAPPITEMRALVHPQEARRVGAPTHGVVSSSECATGDHCELRNGGRGHGVDHLCAVLCDATFFVLAANHEAGGVLQEDDGDAALFAQFDEMRPLTAASAKITPLLAMKPTAWPSSLAKAVTMEVPYSALNSWMLFSSARVSMTSCAS